MTTGLIFTTRATTGREGKYVSRHFCILESQCATIDHLNVNKTDKTRQSIESAANMKIRNSITTFTEFYEATGKHLADWEAVYDALDVSSLKDYDHLYLMASVDLHTDGMTRVGNQVNKFPKSKVGLKFVSHGKVYVNILAMLKAHKIYNIPLHEYQYDTGEISPTQFHVDYRPIPSKYAAYHNYDLPMYGIQRMDSLQYYLNKSKSVLTAVKDTDFIFAYNVMKNSNRGNYVAFIEELATKFGVAKLFTRNDITGVDTSIDSDIYSELVKHTKFTLILPAYESKSFAIDRLLTALSSDCLPLLHPMCQVKDVEASYGVSLADLTLQTPDDALKYDEILRLELLEYYQEKFLTVRKWPVAI